MIDNDWRARLRSAVVTRVDELVVVVAVGLLVLNGLTVGIATFAHVLQHQRLIGMRRAIGASAAGIAAALLLEASMIAAAGAAVGALIGAAMAAAASTSTVVPVGWLVAGVGMAIGVNALAAVPPAVRAARIEPARAIQAR